MQASRDSFPDTLPGAGHGGDPISQAEKVFLFHFPSFRCGNLPLAVGTRARWQLFLTREKLYIISFHL
jgi:hypothetical protein